MNKKKLPAIRVLSHEQFKRLTLDQKLIYLASAFRGLVEGKMKTPFILPHLSERRKSRSLRATKRGR